MPSHMLDMVRLRSVWCCGTNGVNSEMVASLLGMTSRFDPILLILVYAVEFYHQSVVELSTGANVLSSLM